jgi:hypothetical protein
MCCPDTPLFYPDTPGFLNSQDAKDAKKRNREKVHEAGLFSNETLVCGFYY